MKPQEVIVRYQVPGARRWSNYAWGCIMFLGGLVFYSQVSQAILIFSYFLFLNPLVFNSFRKV